MTGVMNQKRCGGCKFAKIMAQDLARRVCWGGPPQPLQATVTGGKMQVQFVRPIVMVSDDACSLYQAKEAEDVAREDRDIAAMRELETRQ